GASLMLGACAGDDDAAGGAAGSGASAGSGGSGASGGTSGAGGAMSPEVLAGDCASAEGGNVICYSGICLLERRGAAGDGPCVVTNDNGVPTETFTCDPEDGVYCDRGANVCAVRVPGG